MLLREAIVDSVMSKYGIIILDEAHERTVNSDVLLAIIKGIIQKRKELRVVIMSATLEIPKFQKYFGTKDNVVKVEGRTFPISIYHTMEPQVDYISTIVKTIV